MVRTLRSVITRDVTDEWCSAARAPPLVGVVHVASPFLHRGTRMRIPSLLCMARRCRACVVRMARRGARAVARVSPPRTLRLRRPAGTDRPLAARGRDRPRRQPLRASLVAAAAVVPPNLPALPPRSRRGAENGPDACAIAGAISPAHEGRLCVLPHSAAASRRSPPDLVARRGAPETFRPPPPRLGVAPISGPLGGGEGSFHVRTGPTDAVLRAPGGDRCAPRGMRWRSTTPPRSGRWTAWRPSAPARACVSAARAPMV